MKKKSGDQPIRVDRDGYVLCRVCGCSEFKPCEPPCAWADDDLCTACYIAAEAVSLWLDVAHRPSRTALLREVARIKKVQGAQQYQRCSQSQGPIGQSLTVLLGGQKGDSG